MDANVNVEPAVTRNPHTGQILFRSGRMLHFITTRPFTLGQTGVQVREGTDIYFDGTKAIVDGAEYTLPFLRGAVSKQWLVPAEEYDPVNENYGQRVSANIQVRHATNGGNPLNPNQRMAIATTESDEREVGNVTAHARNTRQGNNSYVRGQTGVNVVQPGTTVRTQRGMMVVEEQDGVEVPGRTLKTAAGEKAKMTRTDLSSDRAAEALRQANTVQIEPGRGVTQEEMLARMTPDQQAEYLARKDAARSQYVDDAPAPVPAQPQARRTVARVQTAKSGEESGMRYTTSVGGGTEISDGDGDVVGKIGQDKVETYEQEGIKFTTTNGPRRPQAPVTDENRMYTQAEVQAAKRAAGPSPEVRLKLAKQICPEFPDNYDFALSSKKKLARITADYEDRPDVLRAIFAAEDDEMKSLLVAEFPAVFS